MIKTALAATLAVYFAWLFDLNFFLSAGILAILSVEVTREKNIRNAAQRLLASLLGLAMACMMFEALGYHMWVLGLFIVVSFPLLAAIHLKDGIITGVVIVTHIFEVGQINVQSLFNEVSLLLIGIGTATIINFLYMPRFDRQLVLGRQEVEHLFGIIFTNIGEFLRDARSDWAGSELLRVERVLANGLQQAEQEMENNLFGASRAYWYTYFKMREQQLESIRHMLVLTAQVSRSLPQGVQLAELFFWLRDDLREPNYTGNTERRLRDLIAHFQAMPLPQTRSEFETRSALLQLMHEMGRYVSIARAKKAVPK